MGAVGDQMLAERRARTAPKDFCTSTSSTTGPEPGVLVMSASFD